MNYLEREIGDNKILMNCFDVPLDYGNYIEANHAVVVVVVVVVVVLTKIQSLFDIVPFCPYVEC